MHKLHNSQNKFVCKSLITRSPPLVFSSGGFQASIPGKCAGFGLSSLFSLPCKLSGCKFTALDSFGVAAAILKRALGERLRSLGPRHRLRFGSVSSNSRGISTQLKSNRKIGVEPTVNSNLSFLVAEIFVFLNYSKIVLLRQENIRIMLAVLLLEKGQKLCSIPQIMPNIMLAQSARAYLVSGQKKHVASISSTPEPAIWSCDTGQRIACFYSCRWTITWIFDIKDLTVT